MEKSGFKYDIIADAGSTKVDWLFRSVNGNNIFRIRTEGINGVVSSESYIRNIFSDLKQRVEEMSRSPLSFEVDSLHYYGAGCIDEAVNEKIKKIFREVFPEVQEMEIASDMVGAARALFKEDKGIACILGTGSNSCLYSGKEILENVPPLGFILGDEGSGASIGKTFLRDVFKGVAPDKLASTFKQEYKLDVPTLLRKVYKEPSPNAFLASVLPFLKTHVEEQYVRDLIGGEFERFIHFNVSRYPDSHDYPLGFIGSVAVNFKDILTSVVEKLDYEIKTILSDPLEGMSEYHNRLKL